MRLKLFAGVGVVACAGFLAACGGSNDQKTLSKEAFVAKADQACVSTDKQFPPVKITDLSSAKRSLQTEIAARSKINEQIAGLNEPGALSSAASQYQANGAKIVGLLRQEQGVLGKNNQAYYRLDFQVSELAQKRGKLAAQLGFRQCAKGLTGPASNVGDATLIAKADAICRAANQAVLAATTSGPPATDLSVAKAAYDKTLPAVRKTVDEMKAIQAPARYAKDWKQFVSNYERRVDITAKQREAAAADDVKAFQKWSSLDTGEQGIEAQTAEKLGLEVCGANGTAGV